MKPIRAGFETVGHGTLIVHDEAPVLATDPWTRGTTAFSAFRLTHEVPEAQHDAIERSPYLWLSQDTSDHVHEESLSALSRADRTILLPDHHGDRLRSRVERLGFTTRTLRDGIWIQLSDRVRVCCYATVLQQACLLVDVGGRLLVNANAANTTSIDHVLRAEIERFDEAILLSSTGHGTPLLRVEDAAGTAWPPPTLPGPPGVPVENRMRWLGVTTSVPLACSRRHARRDNLWATAHVPSILAHDHGSWLEPDRLLAMPPGVRWDFEGGWVGLVDAPLCPTDPIDPDQLGEPLEGGLTAADRDLISGHVRSLHGLGAFIAKVRFESDGPPLEVPLESDVAPGRFITISVSAGALLEACRTGRFGELLEAGFAKLTIHGIGDPNHGWRVFPAILPLLGFTERSGATSEQASDALIKGHVARGFTRLNASGPSGPVLPNPISKNHVPPEKAPSRTNR